MDSTRREFLKTCACLGAGSVAGSWLLSGCGYGDDGGMSPDPLTVTGTYEIDLTSYPALASDNSVVAVSGTAAGSIFITHTTGDTYFALSRICSHRGCTVNPTTPTLNCPCHGSRYDLSGSVVEGPAPRALQMWPATRDGDTLTVNFG